MLEPHELVVRPVEVVRDEGHLLVQRGHGIGLHASPMTATLRAMAAPPIRAFAGAISGSASSPELSDSYNRSRCARSDAYSPSITVVLTSASEPSRVMTRARTITARYASFNSGDEDRKSTRLNSSHTVISYAV